MAQSWWKRDPARYSVELETAVNVGGFRRVHSTDRLILQRTVDVDGTDHTVRIEYPDDFPWVAPRVWEIDPNTGERIPWPLGYHIYPNDQALCLYTLGSGDRGWRPEYTIADILGRYGELRRVADEEVRLGRATASVGLHAPQLPQPQVFVPKELATFCLESGHWGGCSFVQVPAKNPTYVVLVRVNADESNGTAQDISELNRDWLLLPVVRTFSSPSLFTMWVRYDDMGFLEKTSMTESDVDTITEKLPPTNREAARRSPELFIISGTTKQPCARLLQKVDGSMKTYKVIPVEVVDVIERVFSRVDGKMSGREALKSLSVVMVGLGSLGSHVALHLAKAGVARFFLFDPDRLELENLTRYIGAQGMVGYPKVDVVRGAIAQVHPGADVQAIQAAVPFNSISGDSIQLFHKLCAQPNTLIVVTTAIDAVERAINQIAVEANTPVIFGSVIGSGQLGRVFRVIPGETPCYQCIVDTQNRQPEKFPRFGAGPDNPVAPYHQGGIPALGMDVEIIANFTARMALQTLGRMTKGLARISHEPSATTANLRVPSGRAPSAVLSGLKARLRSSPVRAPRICGQFDALAAKSGEKSGLDIADAWGDHLLWSNDNTEYFDHPLQLRWENYPRNPECPVCGVPAEGPIQSPAVDVARVAELEAKLDH